jgi:hypothetical protein
MIAAALCLILGAAGAVALAAYAARTPPNPTPARPTCTIAFAPASTHQGNSSMATPLVGTVTPGPADPTLVIAKRTVTVTVTNALGIAGEPQTQDAIGGPVHFQINAGDSYKGSLVDVSAGGVSSLAFEFGDIAHDTMTIPATPTAVVTFAPAPAPAA